MKIVGARQDTMAPRGGIPGVVEMPGEERAVAVRDHLKLYLANRRCLHPQPRRELPHMRDDDCLKRRRLGLELGETQRRPDGCVDGALARVVQRRRREALFMRDRRSEEICCSIFTEKIVLDVMLHVCPGVGVVPERTADARLGYLSVIGMLVWTLRTNLSSILLLSFLPNISR